MKVSVVLPTYNEEGNLTPLVTQLLAVSAGEPFTLDVIVVDDGSTDGTARELAALQRNAPALTVVRHPTNRGFAQALKTGIATACQRRCDAAIFMDADLSHRPEDLPRVVEALEGGADVVLGSRFVPGSGMDGVPLWRAVISRAGNIFGRFVLKVPFRDMTTGYRAMRRAVLEQIELGQDGFAIQLESVIKAHAAGFSVVEVPIVLGTRRHGTSSMEYTPRFFRDYWRLLRACRGWLRRSPR